MRLALKNSSRGFLFVAPENCARRGSDFSAVTALEILCHQIKTFTPAGEKEPPNSYTTLPQSITLAKEHVRLPTNSAFSTHQSQSRSQSRNHPALWLCLVQFLVQ